jgi:hypothetical protein
MCVDRYIYVFIFSLTLGNSPSRWLHTDAWEYELSESGAGAKQRHLLVETPHALPSPMSEASPPSSSMTSNRSQRSAAADIEAADGRPAVSDESSPWRRRWSMWWIPYLIYIDVADQQTDRSIDIGMKPN